MSEKKIKGSFIGGYSKKEVNQFISDMSLDFKRQSDEKNATIEFERSRAEKAEEELKLANAKLDEIALMAYNAEQRQKELEKRISDLEKNRVLLSDKLDEMAISAQTAIADLEETRKRFEQECLKNEFNEEKLDALACETYEMMRQSRASDDIYLKIDQKIEEIFKEADEKATEIIKRAQAIADELVNETKEIADPNAKPEPAEITIIEKRPLRTKLILGGIIVLIVIVLLLAVIYVGRELYYYYA